RPRYELRLDRRRPAADHFDDGGIERLGIGRCRFLVDILGVADQCEIGVAQLDRPACNLAPDLVLEERGNGQTPGRAQLLAREPDEGEELALQDAPDL